MTYSFGVVLTQTLPHGVNLSSQVLVLDIAGAWGKTDSSQSELRLHWLRLQWKMINACNTYRNPGRNP